MWSGSSGLDDYEIQVHLDQILILINLDYLLIYTSKKVQNGIIKVGTMFIIAKTIQLSVLSWFINKKNILNSFSIIVLYVLYLKNLKRFAP